ncbi:putative oxalyl-CoA decarboxylase [Helianthus annuus]|nr:putative oxalyl-CoA decarboxylase [Helianthus annuus]
MLWISFLPTPMGKGLLPDTHELAAMSARSLAIGKCDFAIAIVVGARLNWLLHFGESPEWSKDVKFILIYVDEGEIELWRPYFVLNKEIKDDPFCLGRTHPWIEAITNKV